jgi:hypothetical protein
MWQYVFSIWGAVVVISLGTALSSVVAVVAKQWRKAREAELEASLKAEMIKQGRSGQEIEQILRATGRPATSSEEDA